MKLNKTTFGLIVATRGIFNNDLSRTGRAQLLKQVAKAGCEAVILPASETPSGAIETVDDGKKCGRFLSDNRSKIDGIVVVLPNFGDELGVINAISSANLGVPILVQASDDAVDKVTIRERRDSFCGKLSVCNNLYQNAIPFSDTTWHTEPIDGPAFLNDLGRFAGVCRVVRGLKGSRIGAIGTRPQAFQTMRVSEKLLQTSGITVVPVDLSEIIFAALRLKDNDRTVKAKLKEVHGYGKIPKATAPGKIMKAAKLSIAVESWIEREGVCAAGVQCWTSIQENYGCAACLAMSMLGNRGVPMACEVDVGGVIGMLALTLASGNASALLDWNNNYGSDRNKCVNTHCSNFPAEFIGGPVEIGTLGVLSTTLGAENCFGAVKGKVRKGPMSFCRISTDDRNGKIRGYVGEGDFTDDPFPMDGGIAVCKIDGLQKLMKHLCRFGFEHHVGMARGKCADMVTEALRTYMGWEMYVHGEK